MEYGRFNNIKEDSGQMRLEVKGNDYFSVKPEAGVEFKYIQPLAVRTNLTVGLTAAYENELGKVGDVKNEGRVRYTTADWFGIRGEKEDRRGNGKFDLNIEVDRTIFIDGVGYGSALIANKIYGVYAAVCQDPFCAGLARSHSNTNVLCLGGKIIGSAIAQEIVKHG